MTAMDNKDTPLLGALARGAFHCLSFVGRPIGGIRPRRIYEIIGRRAWPTPAYRWHRNRWGDELWVSPHRHIDRCVLAFGCYDPDLHCALEHLLQPGWACLDVGANFGELALHMARIVGATGVVHAFEPAPSQFTRLRQHADRNGNRVHCHQMALSDHSGQITMAVPTESADNQGLGTILASAPPNGYATSPVQTMTLDEFADKHSLARLDFVKLDVQGAEPLVLLGGMNTIRRFMPLIASEISPSDLAATGRTSRQYCDMLTGLGYAIHHLTRRGIGRKIATIADDFYATNVLFVPSHPPVRTNSPMMI